MNKLKSKWLWIFIVIIVIAIILWVNLSKTSESNYVTEKSIIGDIYQTVEVTGSVEAAEDIDLNFVRSGTIYQMNVKAGDEVEAGQVLASLSAGAVASQVADARAGLDIAKLELEQLLAGASNEDLAVTEQELNSARTNYQTALDAKDSLEKTRDQEITSLKAELINTMRDKYSVAQYSLDVVYDAIIDVEAENSLYVGDVVLLKNTRNSYQATKNSFVSLDSAIDNAESSDDSYQILNTADNLENKLEDTLDLLADTYDIMGVTVENSVYTASVISAFKTDLISKIASINTGISAVHTGSSSLRTKELYYETQLKDKQNSIDSYKVSMDLAQAKLDLKKAPPRDFEIESARAKIRRAQASLDRTLSDLAETVIKAPVAGIITKVNFDVGEQTSLSSAVISMIGKSNMEIEVDVPESDIVKLEVGDQVDISLDAFSSEEKFVGTVVFIDPASTNIDGVVYYKVKVNFNENDERIKSGMTADLTIATDSRQNVLMVPSRAIIYREDKKYVQIYNGVSLSEKEVTTGLRGDGGMTEILSGLSEGENVVTYINTGE